MVSKDIFNPLYTRLAFPKTDTLTNSENMHNAALHQGLHCLSNKEKVVLRSGLLTSYILYPADSSCKLCTVLSECQSFFCREVNEGQKGFR